MVSVGFWRKVLNFLTREVAMFQRTFLVLLAVFTGLFFSFSRAEETGIFNGRVTDAQTGEPVANANVVIAGSRFGTATDLDGRFQIANIPVGSYVAQIRLIGYNAQEFPVVIAAGKTASLNVALKAEAVKFREVLVTATREPALSSEVAVATQVISRAQIERAAAQNVGELLENSSGLFIKNNGYLGSLKTVSIRGANDNQVLILLDGQRLNQAQGLAPDLSDLPLHVIERVEIIRGGHSALYGTDAVGGVINLITRAANENDSISGQVNSSIGSFGTRVVEANFGQQLGRLNYLLAHNYTEGDGNFKFDDLSGSRAVRANNDVLWHDAFLKLQYTVNPSALLSGYLQFHDADRGAPGPLSFPSQSATQQDRSWKYRLNYAQRFSSNFDLQAQTFLFKFKQNFDDPNPFFPFNSEHKNDAYGVSLLANWRASNANKITTGYEFREDKINSTDVGSQKRTTLSWFVQDQIKLPIRELVPNSQISLIPALRVDKFTDVDAQLSPKLGLLYNYISGFQLVVRGSLGRSFRLPSFNDLYWPPDPFAVGNPELAPEKGVGYDFGALLNFKAAGFWTFEANYFHTRLKNLIIWGPREDGVFSPDNVQKADVAGVESRATFQTLGRLLNFSFEYNYLDAIDDSDEPLRNGNQLIYRPQHKVDFNLALNFGRLELNGFWRVVGKRFSNPANSAFLESYQRTDLAAGWNQPFIGGRLRLQLAVRNVFDDQTPIIDGFPVPGREYRTALGFDF
jgi:outer membrane cobalamin receptor